MLLQQMAEFEEGSGVFRYGVKSSFILTTTASPSAGGTITRSPDVTSYASGTVVTLTAVPAASYTFTGWYGDLSGSTKPATVRMNGAKTVAASFSAPPTVTPSAGTGGTITPHTP